MLGALSRTQTAPDAVVHDHGALVDRGVPGWRGLLTAAVLSIALGAGLYEGLPGGRSPVSSAARSHKGFSQKGLLSLPRAAQGPVSAALGADRAAYQRARRSGRLRGPRVPGQHLRSSFTSSGVSVSAGAAHIGLGPARGSATAPRSRPFGAVPPSARANRVLYAQRGRERVVRERAARAWSRASRSHTHLREPAPGPLTLSIALSGNALRLAREGRTEPQADPRGRARSATRAVCDRRPRTPATQRLSLKALGSCFTDTTGARYPLRIDPFIQQASSGPRETRTRNRSSDPGVSVALLTDGKIPPCAAVLSRGRPERGPRRGRARALTRRGRGCGTEERGSLWRRPVASRSERFARHRVWRC